MWEVTVVFSPAVWCWLDQRWRRNRAFVDWRHIQPWSEGQILQIGIQTVSHYGTWGVISLQRYPESYHHVIIQWSHRMPELKLPPAPLNKPSDTMISGPECTLSDRLLPGRHVLAYHSQSFCLFKHMTDSQLRSHMSAPSPTWSCVIVRLLNSAWLHFLSL